MAKQTVNKNIITNDDDFKAKVDETLKISLELEALTPRQKIAVTKLKEYFSKKKKALKARVDDLMSAITPYAVAHKQALLGAKRSACTGVARFGFRLGNDTLVPAVPKTTEKSLLAILLEKEGGKEFLSVAYNLDKSKITETIKKNPKHWLAEMFKINQDESFFVEMNPDKETEVV